MALTLEERQPRTEMQITSVDLGDSESVITAEGNMGEYGRVYGDAAVASFLRLFDVAPPGKPANATGRAWFSMFLVKENDEWKIAHHHVSSAS